MHIPTVARKIIFFSLRKILLSDPVRNFAYEWAWFHLRSRGPRARICDIGSRSSAFPAFCSWQGHTVAAVERDSRFVEKQKQLAALWGVRLEVMSGELAGIQLQPARFDTVLSLFSLQHAGDEDTKNYRAAVALLRENGMLLSVSEYRHAGTVWQRGRDDGDLRRYGPEDIVRRIKEPCERIGVRWIDERYAARLNSGRVVWSTPEKADFCFLCGVKRR